MNEQTRVLLENNADPFLQSGSDHECPASIALRNGYSSENKILDSFIELVGNKTDYQGEGLLHYAAKIADIATVKKMVSKGLDRNLRNVAGETPADIAKRWERNEVASILQ